MLYWLYFSEYKANVYYLYPFKNALEVKKHLIM